MMSINCKKNYSTSAFAAPLLEDDEWVLVPDEHMQLRLMNLKDVEFQMNLDNRGSFNVVFRLYTRENPKEGEIIVPGDAESLAKSNFNPNNPTR